MKTVTAEKSLESYRSEIFDTLEKDKDVWRLKQTNIY